MDEKQTLIAFAALSQETRLRVFRLLVQAGDKGLLSGEIGETLEVKQNTMSANLSVLVTAGLIHNTREGRCIRYFARTKGIRGLLEYLLEDCCGGKPELCQPAINAIAKAS